MTRLKSIQGINFSPQSLFSSNAVECFLYETVLTSPGGAASIKAAKAIDLEDMAGFYSLNFARRAGIFATRDFFKTTR